jgi:hypothetical protein
MSNYNNFSNRYRYTLEKSSKKYVCPNCGDKSLVRYIDIETGNYIPEQYGCCDHKNKCIPHYHLNPYNDGYAKMIWRQENNITGITKITSLKNIFFRTQQESQPSPEPVFIPHKVLKQTLKQEQYNQNRFIQNLLSRIAFPFELKDVEKVISLYYLGTVANGYRAGAITFPFIDIKSNVRAIQVKEFDNNNHTSGTDFLHSIIEKQHQRKNEPLPEWLVGYKRNDLKVSCLFGEHIMNKYPYNPIALVEAPKTAIYGTLYFGFPNNPKNLIWLAVYNLSSLNYRKCKVLRGRDVYLFPDLSKEGKAFELWEKKATELSDQIPETIFNVSDLLEKHASEVDKKRGYDIGDYLIRHDWRKFRKPAKKERAQPNPVPVETSTYQPLPKVEVIERIELPEKEQPKNWVTEITVLETHFNNIRIPSEPIKLNDWTTITNVSLFIENHLNTVKFYKGVKAFKPYLDRLTELKIILN